MLVLSGGILYQGGVFLPSVSKGRCGASKGGVESLVISSHPSGPKEGSRGSQTRGDLKWCRERTAAMREYVRSESFGC